MVGMVVVRLHQLEVLFAQLEVQHHLQEEQHQLVERHQSSIMPETQKLRRSNLAIATHLALSWHESTLETTNDRQQSATLNPVHQRRILRDFLQQIIDNQLESIFREFV
uniref:Uncharacterized protein n=1 Tax=Ascaris lumbricoides TaxID=6252 RepID=A0A0M3I6L2_ASCLU